MRSTSCPRALYDTNVEQIGAPAGRVGPLSAALGAIFTAERGRFVLFLPVFMAAGITLYFALPQEPWQWLGAGAAAIAAAATALSWRLPVPRACCLCLLAASLGFGSASLATRLAPAWDALPRRGVTVTGTIGMLEALPAGRRITILAPSLDGATPLGRAVRIRLRGADATILATGDRIQVRALLKLPSPPDYPGGWDTQRDAYFGGMAGYGFAIGTAERIGRGATPSLLAMRTAIAARVLAALPGENGAIAATLLTGIGTAIAPSDRLAFQSSGLAHLLAVAGLHIGIVMGLVFGLTRMGLAACERTALYWPTKQLASIAALAAGAFYLALTGAHVPILRSFAMACLVTLAVITGRRAVSLRALAIAATALMLAAPQEVVGVSFQMSFSAVLALIAGYEAVRPVMARLGPDTWWRRPVLHFGGLAMTSLIAGTASLPFAAYHFGRATLWYVPANLLAVPVTAFWVLPWGMAALLLMPLHAERLALVPMGWGIHAIMVIARTVAAWPAANVAVPQMPAWALCLVAAGLAILCIWRTRIRLVGLAPLLAGLLAPMVVHAPDIVVGPDAAIIALRDDGRILVQQLAHASAFEQQAPERVWGSAAHEALTCDQNACPVQLGTATILLVGKPADVSCRGATILVSSVSLGDVCPGLPHVDRASVRRDGATSVSLSGRTALITTDRDIRGDRPWVIGRLVRFPAALAE